MKLKRYSFIYFLKLAFNGVFRNGVMSLASIIVLISCLLVTGTSWALIKNIDVNLEELNGYNKVVVFVESEADSALVSEIGSKLEAISGVTEVTFESKDDSLNELIKQYGDTTAIFEMFKGEGNPLKDSYTVVYDDASKVDTIVYQIEQINGVYKINNRRDVAEKIDSLKNIIQLIFTWLMILLFVVALFVIINTVKLNIFARREEIAIMKYVGATRLYVAMPYVLEGLIIGLIATGLAFAAQYYLYKYYAVDTLGSYGVITIIKFSKIRNSMLAIFGGVGIGTGVFASLISLRKYNKA